MRASCVRTDDLQSLKMMARRLWERDRAGWIATQPFLASLALRLNIVPVVDSRLPTAATDGWSVFVSAPFLLSLTPEERQFVLAHEIWHCALGHIGRRLGRDRERWNVAADHEVNALLAEQGLKVPQDAVLFRCYRGLSAEEVYAALPADTDTGRGSRADLHDLALDAEGSGPFDPDLAPRLGSPRDWRGAVQEAARAAIRRGGALPRRLRLAVECAPAPRLDWRGLLRRFVTRSVERERQWHRPDRRRLAQGLYLPSCAQTRPRLAIAIDASGSCMDYLARFLAEVRAASRGVGLPHLRVLSFDAEVQSDVQLVAGKPITAQSLDLRGGGGTRFGPVLDHLTGPPPEVDGLIFLTDGYGSAPPAPPTFPVLWVLTPDGTAPARWADCVMMQEEGRAVPDASGCYSVLLWDAR